MKNNKLLVLGAITVLSLFSTTSLAAKKRAPINDNTIVDIDRTQSISFYPLGFAGRFGVTYSFQISDNIALTPGIGSSYVWPGLSSTSAIFDIGPTFGARFFLSNTAFNTGWYIEPTIGLGYARLEPKNGPSLNSWSASVQGTGGYAWYWESGFTLGLGAGLAYNIYPGSLADALGREKIGNWLRYPRVVMDFSLGYSW